MTTTLAPPLPRTEAVSDLTGSRPVSSSRRIDGVVVGQLVDFDESGRSLVRFGQAVGTEALVARVATPLSARDIGRDIAILCESGDPTRPIVIGLMHQDRWREEPSDGVGEAPDETVTLDLNAKRQITLRCGKASITLTRAGKIILRGTYLVNRSSGVNKIKGGSVQIN